MIIAKLMGGLGNQMFQYALGRRLAVQHGVELKVDLDFLLRESHVTPGTTVYEYGLPNFALTVAAASAEEVAQLRPAPVRGWRRTLRRTRLALTPTHRRTHVQEKSLAFEPRVLRAGPHAYVEGYWQSPHYFDAIAARIRADFQVKRPAEGRNAALLEQIAGSTAIAVHVRRGDYVTSPSAARVHGVCGLDYYQAALRLIQERVAAPQFFVFSDNPDWVRQNLPVPGPATYVDHNGPRPWEDIRLMRACRHFVIANSSFSWWGAWLSESAGKIVIAPKRWALEPGLNVATRHPADWLTV